MEGSTRAILPRQFRQGAFCNIPHRWRSGPPGRRSGLASEADAAKGLFAKTKAGGVEVQKSMDALVTELNTVAATLTPAKK